MGGGLVESNGLYFPLTRIMIFFNGFMASPNHVEAVVFFC